MKINEIASLKALVSNRAPEIIPDEMIHHFTKASTQHHLNKLAIALMMICSQLLWVNEAKATHSAGSDLTYTWVSGNTYRVTVAFYRDCAGVAAPNSITLNARSSSCSRNQNFTLNLVAGSGQEITFPCRTAQTKCTNSSSSNAGYQQYLYQNNVTLPQQCSDWVLSYYVCCRNCAITTLNNPCNDNMYVEATLNNLLFQRNNSPQFTNIPVAFLCVNQSFTYNHGVVDPDGDSLVYSFITPRTYNTSTNTTGNVTFNAGYSASQPLTSSPAVNINSVTGDINMFPTVNGEIGVTAILVREYRNGVLIGSVVRDMQFLTKICNPNLLPTATGINGSSNFSAVVCPGSTITFSVNSSDPNATDTVIMNWNNVIPGATFTTVGAQFPIGTFTWTPSVSDARSQPYTFIVTVRDNACPTNGSQTYSFSLVVPVINTTVSSPQYNGYNVACAGAATGSVTATTVGGTLPYTYSWNPSGQTTQTATALASGTYTVTVTDASGCTSSAQTSLSEPPAPVAAGIASSINVSCNAGTDGSANSSISGGLTPYTYAWSPGGQTTANLTAVGVGTYTVTITDLNGCTDTAQVAITEPTALVASITGFTNVTCLGNSNGTITTSVSGGTGPYTHHWSNGATTANLTGLGPATYADTVRDANGCTQIITQVITEPGTAVSLPGSSLSLADISCFGGSNGSATLTPSGGTPPYTISWSNGDAGNTADTLIAGSYTVTVEDANGCTVDSTFSIGEPLLLVASFSDFTTTPGGTNIDCNGATNGGVSVSPVGGTPPYTYLWSTGATIDSIAGVGAGNYWVTVTDVNGCKDSINTPITEPTPLLNTLTKFDVVCKGEASGWINANTSGGSPGYTYNWTPLGQTTDSIGGLFAGFYSVTITDLNGCSRLDTISILEPDTLVPLITAIQFFGDVNVRCAGDSSATVWVEVTGGTSPYTYLWSNGGINDTLFNLPAGSVEVYVRDVNGCSIVGSTALSQPTPFSYNTIIASASCSGDSSAYILLNLGGSTPPYTYNWSTGATTDSVGGLPSGTYWVLIEDANNCEDSVGFVLSDPPVLNITASVSDYQGYNVSCNGSTNGEIHLSIAGGTGIYTYSWSNGATTDSVTGLPADTISVTITDSNGCSEDTSFVISAPDSVSIGLTSLTYSGGFNISCFGYNDGRAYAATNGGVGPYTYSWSNGDVADSAIGLFAGPVTVTVTDSNGCVATSTITLTEPLPMNMSATLSDFNGFNVPCNGDSLACVTVAIGGGTIPYIYDWNGYDTITTAQICNLPADTLGLRVFDANGCVLDTNFDLTEPPVLDVLATVSDFNGFNVSCFGSTNGSIDQTISGGVNPYSYQWSTTATSEDLTGLAAGTYTFVLTDANGCSRNASYTLSEPPAILDSIGSVVAATCGTANGTATVFVYNGLTPYSYSWSPGGATTASVTGLNGGQYFVTITDSVGCTTVDSVSISAIPVMGAVVGTQTDVLCPGAATGSATVTLSGGTAPFTYAWTNGDTGSSADSLAAGSISVTVTDANGCVETTSATISEPGAFVFTPTVTDARCSGINDGSVAIGISGGTAPYSVSWSNGDTGLTADSLSGGYVTYTVTDDNGCVVADSANVNQPSSIVSNLSASTDVRCNGDANGTATATAASGGTAPYSYTWSNGETGLSADSLIAGNTTLTITDANGCTLQLTATIGQPVAFAVTAQGVDVSCFGQTDGSAQAGTTGGISPASFVWIPGGGTTAAITNLTPGTYSVTATDANGCTSTDVVTIDEPAQLLADAGSDQGGCEPTVSLNAGLGNGQTGTWSVFSGTASFSSISSPLASVSGLAVGDNLLVWTITDGTCYGYDTLVVRLDGPDLCGLELPSGFSPNGDGKNDGYEIRGVNQYPDNMFRVFNRWGNLVYEREDYTSNDWVGQNKEGDPLPDGTYFVTFEVTGQDIRRSTYVDMRR